MAQAFSTYAMAAVSRFVQPVQYPSFAKVDPAAFNEFHDLHSARITLIEGPVSPAFLPLIR